MAERGKWERGVWPPEIVEFIRNNASNEVTIKDMRLRILEEFGAEYSYEQVKRYYYYNGLPFCRHSRHNILLSDEQAAFMISIIPGRPAAEVVEMMNEKYGLNLTLAQVRGWKKNHKTPSGYSAQFRPGQQSYNKGKTWAEFLPPEAQENSRQTCFKKGNVPKNKVPIGTITARTGYLWIKIKDNFGPKNFKLYHRYVWENANGPVPKGYKIFFLDGNTYNCSLENLKLIPEGLLAVANQKYGRSRDPEINKLILKAAELKMAVAAAEKKGKQ